MLVEEQMKLAKSRTCHLPMRLLVQIAHGNCVRKQLSELSSDLQPDRLLKFQRKQMVNGAA